MRTCSQEGGALQIPGTPNIPEIWSITCQENYRQALCVFFRYGKFWRFKEIHDG
jgi:hypothetical protein